MYVQICIQMNLFYYNMYISFKRHELIGYSPKISNVPQKQKKNVIKFIKAAAVYMQYEKKYDWMLLFMET